MSFDQIMRQASRRHFLRGMGVALALPWLESLPLIGQTVAAAKSATPPLRLGIVFFSNGVEPIHWWAKGAGADMQIGPGLTADDAASRGHGLHPGPLSTRRRRHRRARTSGA